MTKVGHTSEFLFGINWWTWKTNNYLKNHDRMLYCTLDMARNRFNCYFLFWAIFLPFHLPNSPKNQNLEKVKKDTWRYHHFTYVYHKLWLDDVRLLRYGSWRMWLFFILDYYLPFYPHNSPKKQNFEKIKSTPRDIIILHTCTKWCMYGWCMVYGWWCMVPEIWCVTDVIVISHFGPFFALLLP